MSQIQLKHRLLKQKTSREFRQGFYPIFRFSNFTDLFTLSPLLIHLLFQSLNHTKEIGQNNSRAAQSLITPLVFGNVLFSHLKNTIQTRVATPREYR